MIIVRLKKALFGLKHAPRLWYDNINAILLSLGFAHTLANPTLCLCSYGIQILQDVHNIAITYPEAATEPSIQVQAKLSRKYYIMNLCQLHQFLAIKIDWNDIGTGIGLGQKAYITTILRRFSVEHCHTVSTPLDPKVKSYLAEDRGEKELVDITDYQAVV
jgi:hypothetical protein